MIPVTRDGITYFVRSNRSQSPDRCWRLPFAPSTDFSPSVRPISTHVQCGPIWGNRGSTVGAEGPVPAIDNAPPYLVSEILSAYDATALGVNGGGQTIAILIDTVPNPADLAAFWAKNGVAVNPAQIQEVNVNGGSPPPPSGEETLDVSWASGIACSANVRVYASGSLTFVALDKAIDQIISDLQAFPGMRQLSISLGLGEDFMAPAEVATQHTKFLQLAATGVNVFVSSGDAGSNPDSTGHDPTGPLQPEYAGLRSLRCRRRWYQPTTGRKRSCRLRNRMEQ